TAALASAAFPTTDLLALERRQGGNPDPTRRSRGRGRIFPRQGSCAPLAPSASEGRPSLALGASEELPCRRNNPELAPLAARLPRAGPSGRAAPSPGRGLRLGRLSP